jgi:hypothetical protein
VKVLLTISQFNLTEEEKKQLAKDAQSNLFKELRIRQKELKPSVYSSTAKKKKSN